MSITPMRRRLAPLAVAGLLVAATATTAIAADESDPAALPAVSNDGEALVVTWPEELATDEVDVDAAGSPDSDSNEGDPFVFNAEPVTFDTDSAERLGSDGGYILGIEPTSVIDASVDPDAIEGEWLSVAIADVQGPGDVVLTATDLGSSTTSADTNDPLYVPASAPTETTWLVTQPGDYDVTVEIAASLPGGRATAVETSIEFAVIAISEQSESDESAADIGDNAADTEVAADEGEDTDAPDVNDDPETTKLRQSADNDLPLAPAQASGRLVLDVGHVDAFEVSVDGSNLQMQSKDDTFLHDNEVVYRDPADLLFHVLPDAATQIPSGDDFAFLGDAGDNVYMLPLTQDPDLLWPGWSTERISSSQVDGPVELSITSLDGPGDLKIFTSGTFGGNQVLVDSEDGLPDRWDVAVPAHVHANWAFTETGRYTMTVQADATLAGGGANATTGEVTYVWHVGNLDDDGPSGSSGNGSNGGSGGGSGTDGANGSNGTNGSNGSGGSNGSDDSGGPGSGDGADGDGAGDGDPSGGGLIGTTGGAGDGSGSGSGPGAGSGSGSGPGSGSGSGSGGDGGSLPFTGTDATLLTAVAALLTAVGSFILFRTRKFAAAHVRRDSNTSTS